MTITINTDNDFIEAVKIMRTAQKDRFITPGSEAWQIAKEAEEAVDKYLLKRQKQ